MSERERLELALYRAEVATETRGPTLYAGPNRRFRITFDASGNRVAATDRKTSPETTWSYMSADTAADIIVARLSRSHKSG